LHGGSVLCICKTIFKLLLPTLAEADASIAAASDTAVSTDEGCHGGVTHSNMVITAVRHAHQAPTRGQRAAS
jgi:hypothetical protein